MPAEAMKEFFECFERTLAYDPEAMQAAQKSGITLSIILTEVNAHGKHVASLPRSWRQDELVRNPASLVPALVAKPRPSGSPSYTGTCRKVTWMAQAHPPDWIIALP